MEPGERGKHQPRSHPREDACDGGQRLFHREQRSRELLYPEMFQRRRDLEGDDKGKVWRKVWQSAGSQILSELTIKEHRSIRTWRRAQQQRTSGCSHSCASFRGFRNDPSDEGGERRAAGAHQRRRGRGAKPGRGGRDAESRRSSPGILLSERAERARGGRAGIKPAELTTPLPVAPFKIRGARAQTRDEATL